MLSFFRKTNDAHGLTALGLHADGVSLARAVVGASGRGQLAGWEFRAWDGDNRQKTLARLSSDFGLKRARCALVLQEHEYKLLLTEAPDVRPDELKAAIRWRVKELIDFHINDATLDVFELPTAAPNASRPMYAVVAQSQLIRDRVELLTGAGINLDIIDIPELAQRNLAAQLQADASGVVFLSLRETHALITVTKQGSIYLSRTVDVGIEALRANPNSTEYFDGIVLEVQRSLDYYDSHFRQAPIQSLVIGPLAIELPGLLEHLNNNLNVKATNMDLSAVLPGAEKLTHEAQVRCLMTIGAALRGESKAL